MYDLALSQESGTCKEVTEIDGQNCTLKHNVPQSGVQACRKRLKHSAPQRRLNTETSCEEAEAFDYLCERLDDAKKFKAVEVEPRRNLFNQ